MGNLSIVALKTEDPITFCTDAQRPVINSKGGSCVWYFWSNLFPSVRSAIYLINAAGTHCKGLNPQSQSDP